MVSSISWTKELSKEGQSVNGSGESLCLRSKIRPERFERSLVFLDFNIKPIES